MEINNILNINNKELFYKWLENNSAKETECWIEVKKGRPVNNDYFWYIDAVEVALCFGWIDNINKVINGKRLYRFSKRNKNSLWTELNKERVRRLEKLGLMTYEGRKVLPDMDINSFKIDMDIENALKEADVWNIFISFPILYQRIRAYNVSFSKSLGNEKYNAALKHLIEETKKGKMYGQWNDYGRLLEY